MGQTAYAQLSRIVSGAVRDAFNRHPDYLTNKGRQSAARSIVKRVTGTVLGFAVQAAGVAKAAESVSGELFPSDTEASGVGSHHSPSYAYIQDRCYHAIRRALFPSTTRELRRDAKRFRIRLKAKTSQLRSELQASSNHTLSEAIEAIRERVG